MNVHVALGGQPWHGGGEVQAGTMHSCSCRPRALAGALRGSKEGLRHLAQGQKKKKKNEICSGESCGVLCRGHWRSQLLLQSGCDREPLALFLALGHLYRSQCCRTLAGVKLKWVLCVVPQETREIGRSLHSPLPGGENSSEGLFSPCRPQDARTQAK